MKKINTYIIEKLKITKDTKITKNDYQYKEGQKCLFVAIESSDSGLDFGIYRPLIFLNINNGIFTYNSINSAKSNTKYYMHGLKLNSHNIYERFNEKNSKYDVLLPKNIGIKFLNDILDGRKPTKDILLDVFDKEDEFINDWNIHKIFSEETVENYLNDLVS